MHCNQSQDRPAYILHFNMHSCTHQGDIMHSSTSQWGSSWWTARCVHHLTPPCHAVTHGRTPSKLPRHCSPMRAHTAACAGPQCRTNKANPGPLQAGTLQNNPSCRRTFTRLVEVTSCDPCPAHSLKALFRPRAGTGKLQSGWGQHTWGTKQQMNHEQSRQAWDGAAGGSAGGPRF